MLSFDARFPPLHRGAPSFAADRRGAVKGDEAREVLAELRADAEAQARADEQLLHPRKALTDLQEHAVKVHN